MPNKKGGHIRSRILKLLSENKELRAREIIDKLTSQSPVIHRALRQLIAENLIFYKYGEHPENSSWIKYYSLNWGNALD